MNFSTKTGEGKAAKRARQLEQLRAENAVVDTTQNLLDDETRTLMRKYGRRSGFSMFSGAGSSRAGARSFFGGAVSRAAGQAVGGGSYGGGGASA